MAAWRASGSPGVRAPCSRTSTTDASSTVVTAPPHHTQSLYRSVGTCRACHSSLGSRSGCRLFFIRGTGDGLTAACDKAQHVPENGLPPLHSAGLRRQRHVGKSRLGLHRAWVEALGVGCLPQAVPPHRPHPGRAGREHAGQPQRSGSAAGEALCREAHLREEAHDKERADQPQRSIVKQDLRRATPRRRELQLAQRASGAQRHERHKAQRGQAQGLQWC